MAKNEDLSMDEILSSIRNILIEDGSEDENSVPAEPLEEEIIDLSASQIIAEEAQALSSLSQESYVDEEIPLPEIQDKDVIAAVDNNIAIDMEAEPIYSSEDDTAKPDFNAEPIYQEDDEFLDHADVSEKLLSNFAQMFAKKEEDIAQKPISIAPAPVQISSSNSLDSIISAEISKQVKAWLDANMPIIAQDLVKEELSRVMARAGK